MAEIVGTIASAITLAEVFKICVGAFELFRAAKDHEAEVKKLNLKLNIEKCRLLIRGDSIGLANSLDGGAPTTLYKCPFPDTVREALEAIIGLLSNSQDLAGKYGCRKLDDAVASSKAIEDRASDPASRLAAAFGRYTFDKTVKERAKATGRVALWVIHDQKKFALLVRDAKEFIDGLQDITKGVISQNRQEQDFGNRISTINDPETLQMITEVCESDHPAFSDAASQRADVLTTTMTDKQDITQWLNESEADEELSLLVEDIESWSVSDLRRQYLILHRQKSGCYPSGYMPDINFTPPGPALIGPESSYAMVPTQYTTMGRAQHYIPDPSFYPNSDLLAAPLDAGLCSRHQHYYPSADSSLQYQKPFLRFSLPWPHLSNAGHDDNKQKKVASLQPRIHIKSTATRPRHVPIPALREDRDLLDANKITLDPYAFDTFKAERAATKGEIQRKEDVYATRRVSEKETARVREREELEEYESAMREVLRLANEAEITQERERMPRDLFFGPSLSELHKCNGKGSEKITASGDDSSAGESRLLDPFIPPTATQRTSPSNASPVETRPSNVLLLENLPMEFSRDEIGTLFLRQAGCVCVSFTGVKKEPRCSILFKDVKSAIKAQNELYDTQLPSGKGVKVRPIFESPAIRRQR